MDHFSWSDTFHALLSPCLSCLRAAHPHPHLTNNDHLYDRTRSDQSADLEGLLADSSSSEDAETLSLHSNFGAGSAEERRRRKKKRVGNWGRFWGWDLFGRRPAIQLPLDDNEAEGEDGEGEEGRRRRERRRRPATLSSSTLDSDAAPVDVGAITSQLAGQPDPVAGPQTVVENHEEARERAERKARRKERKELKRAALAFSLEHGGPDGEEFEGFQGSGSAPRIPSPFTRAHRHQDSISSHTSSSGHIRSPPILPDDEQELADADFDAHSYAKRRTTGGSGGSGSRSRSDSHSRSSASQGQIPYNHYQASSPFPPSPLGQPDLNDPGAPIATSTPKPKRSKSKSKSSKSSSSKKSSNNSDSITTSDPTDQSPSLASPTMLDVGGGEQLIDVRREDFLDLNLPSPGFNLNLRLPAEGQTDGPSLSNGGFPSPGLGGPRNLNGGGGAFGKRDVGAFLSKSGWDV